MSETPQLSVLFEDNHLLVVNKPSGLATMGVAPGEDSLWERGREYLKRKYAKPGNVFLGVVSRLDAAVSGVIVLARTSKAAARLSEQFREGTAEKTYLAIVSGKVTAEVVRHRAYPHKLDPPVMVFHPASRLPAGPAILKSST
jgi:23S rRNA pseudouridine1911/1915/1917 synthase